MSAASVSVGAVALVPNTGGDLSGGGRGPCAYTRVDARTQGYKTKEVPFGRVPTALLAPADTHGPIRQTADSRSKRKAGADEMDDAREKWTPPWKRGSAGIYAPTHIAHARGHAARHRRALERSECRCALQLLVGSAHLTSLRTLECSHAYDGAWRGRHLFITKVIPLS